MQSSSSSAGKAAVLSRCVGGNPCWLCGTALKKDDMGLCIGFGLAGDLEGDFLGCEGRNGLADDASCVVAGVDSEDEGTRADDVRSGCVLREVLFVALGAVTGRVEGRCGEGGTSDSSSSDRTIGCLLAARGMLPP